MATIWDNVNALLEFDIVCGQDWQVPMQVYALDKVTPLNVPDPVIEMRRDHTVNSQLLAHLDTAGVDGGLIQIIGVGKWKLWLDSAYTLAMPPGRGFWDCWGHVGGAMTQIASGIVHVSERVTMVV